MARISAENDIEPFIPIEFFSKPAIAAIVPPTMQPTRLKTP